MIQELQFQLQHHGDLVTKYGIQQAMEASLAMHRRFLNGELRGHPPPVTSLQTALEERRAGLERQYVHQTKDFSILTRNDILHMIDCLRQYEGQPNAEILLSRLHGWDDLYDTVALKMTLIKNHVDKHRVVYPDTIVEADVFFDAAQETLAETVQKLSQLLDEERWLRDEVTLYHQENQDQSREWLVEEEYASD